MKQLSEIQMDVFNGGKNHTCSLILGIGVGAAFAGAVPFAAGMLGLYALGCTH